MSLPGKSQPSPAEGEFRFELDPEPLEECLTAYAGIPLLVRALRSLKVADGVKQNIHLKQRQRGFDEATQVESFLVLKALGGDCLEDFDRLREDAGLKEMLGMKCPARRRRASSYSSFTTSRKSSERRPSWRLDR